MHESKGMRITPNPSNILFISCKGSEGDTYTEDCRKYVCGSERDQGYWIDKPDTLVLIITIIIKSISNISYEGILLF